MKSVYLEHANITVNNLERSITFFKTAFPNFKIRGEGISENRRWVHFGLDSVYIALNEAGHDKSIKIQKNYVSSGINHIGFVVENVAEIATNLLAAGFKRDYPKTTEEFRIRDYFADDDGNEFEFVQYLSNNPKERNKY